MRFNVDVGDRISTVIDHFGRAMDDMGSFSASPSASGNGATAFAHTCGMYYMLTDLEKTVMKVLLPRCAGALSWYFKTGEMAEYRAEIDSFEYNFYIRHFAEEVAEEVLAMERANNKIAAAAEAEKKRLQAIEDAKAAEVEKRERTCPYCGKLFASKKGREEHQYDRCKVAVEVNELLLESYKDLAGRWYVNLATYGFQRRDRPARY